MKRIFLAGVLVAISFIFYFKNFSAEAQEDTLKLYTGQVKFISVTHPSRIVIGNPEVLDVTNAGVDQITLNPKASGSTTLVIWDNFGEQSYQVKVFTQDMDIVKARIDNLVSQLGLPDVYTQAVNEEGKVLILGSVKTPEERERVMTALGALKEKVVDLLLVKELESAVDIDVQIVEMNKDMTSTLGFTWPGTIALTDVSGPTTAGVTGLANVFHLSKFTRTAFNTSLDILIQEGKARILSRPRLACQSGKEAELLVGGEKPIFTTTVAATTGAEGTEVQYKEYGIKLKIKPTITEEDRIKLVLSVEVSEVGSIAEIIGATNAPTAKAYPLSKRTTSTELYLNNGQTMAISGLMKEKSEEDIRRTPWLSDLPVLGAMFRKKTTKIGGGTGERGNTELFIILTPTIVNNQKDVQQERIFSKVSNKGSAPPLAIPKPLENYSRIIQRRILDKLTYPPSAKDSGFQGTVSLSLRLAYSGELLDISVKESSGYKILDDNVLSVARSIARFPPFPPALNKKEIWIDVPIDYRLE